MTHLTPDIYKIREAKEKDVLAIAEIYNELVLNSTNVFNCIPVKLETKLEWFRDLKAKGYPVIVAVEIETEKTVAFTDLSMFKLNTAYVLTAEVSVFIHADHKRRGLGHLLVSEILRIGREMRFRCIIAVVVTANEPSINLLTKLGFKKAVLLNEVGYKFEIYHSVTCLEYTMDTKPAILKPNPSFTPFPWGKYTFQEELFTDK